MSTSEPAHPPAPAPVGPPPAVAPIVTRAKARTIAIEVLAAALLVTAVVAAISPTDLWLSWLGFHPAWGVVMVFAARYATRGLFFGLAATIGLLVAGSYALGGSLAGMVARAGSASDLLALTAATLVAWIAMLQESRVVRIDRRLAEANARRQIAEETLDAMKDVIAVLRARHDRIDMSLSMWRELAGRIEGDDPVEAAGAALELGSIRTGATAGMVQAWDGRRLATVAWRGQWSAADPRPRPTGDKTALAALDKRRPTRVTEVSGATSEDSDVAVPIVSPKGELLGVVAFRGIEPGALRAADLRDLTVVAKWIAPRMAPVVEQARLEASLSEALA